MKTVYFFLTCYILALALLPCSDETTCIDEKKSGFSIVNIANHAHSSTEQDVCSPLCICACCSAQIQLAKFSSSLSFFHSTPNTQLVTPYREHIYIENSQTIWQPPKA